MHALSFPKLKRSTQRKAPSCPVLLHPSLTSLPALSLSSSFQAPQTRTVATAASVQAMLKMSKLRLCLWLGNAALTHRWASAVPHGGRLQLDRPPLSAFLGGSLFIHASTLQNTGRLLLAGADTATMCPCVPMGTRTTGGAKETRTPSPLLSPPPSLNEPAPERSFLDPKKRISWCSFYPVPLNDVSDTISSPRPLLSFALLQLGLSWRCRAMTAHG